MQGVYEAMTDERKETVGERAHRFTWEEASALVRAELALTQCADEHPDTLTAKLDYEAAAVIRAMLAAMLAKEGE